MIPPPVWSREELEKLRQEAIEIFREERMEEPLEDYLEAFDEYLGATEELLEATVDLTELESQALEILKSASLREVFRYLAAPPISEADLKTVAAVQSLAPGKLAKDPVGVREIVRTVQIGMDRKRFPWVQENREPSEGEKSAAALATAALLATQRVGTRRRNASKAEQEERVRAALVGAGMLQVPTRAVRTIADAPRVGEFCQESMLGSRKADLIVGLHDNRVLALECKVSNSELNSIKRLNNDAAAKAEVWSKDFGSRNVVPAAVLSGVYKLRHLEQAQDRGLTLFWAHRLEGLVQWIDSTNDMPQAKVAEARPPYRSED